MKLRPFALESPPTLEEACALAGPGSLFLAGGTDLLVRMKRRQLRPKRLISLGRIADLHGVKESPDGALVVGSCTTLAELGRVEATGSVWAGLAETARLTASPLLRNVATVGGNLCLESRCRYFDQPPIFVERWGTCLKLGGDICHAVRRSERCHAVYSGDLAGPLIALDAVARLIGPNAERTVKVAELFTGDGARPHRLAPDEIVTEVRIPRPAGYFGLAYRKLRLRDSLDFPLAGVSVFVRFEGTSRDAPCGEARVVVSGASPAPLLVTPAGDILREGLSEGREVSSLGDEVAALLREQVSPVANAAAPAGYRRQMIGLLARQALEAALARAGQGLDSHIAPDKGR
jgi:4-hydroxybenzoyl-CoA reductase subunit beta